MISDRDGVQLVAGKGGGLADKGGVLAGKGG